MTARGFCTIIDALLHSLSDSDTLDNLLFRSEVELDVPGLCFDGLGSVEEELLNCVDDLRSVEERVPNLLLAVDI